MESIVVEGGRPLEGRIAVSGAKNSVLPLLAAAFCSKTAACYIIVPGFPMWKRRWKSWSIWAAGWTAGGTASGWMPGACAGRRFPRP